ncbi:fibronectin-binding protein [Campylobacter ornithocola]|uniref:Fibronectin-binding protein n=1 Tax=Campylobacter ornithocola TaxID=1848766 RepID=A0A6M8N066_9BACT|nr:OmpA family protein [Campylobacter ornithocola]OCX43143.1 fibronectin-binding protein [Campylobacter ornithocola]QKF56954.1 outer membrane fibronectin-binding protein [Campylobacter ornithocola]
MKKIISLVSLASILFAFDASKIEITPTFSYTTPEGNLDLKNYGGVGLRFGYHYDDLWIDQTELGLEYYDNAKYNNPNNNAHTDTSVSRFYVNAIKGIDLANHVYLYGLLGTGYEYLSHGAYENKSGMFAQYGAGFKFALGEDLALRLEARDQIKFNNGEHNLISSVGLSFYFGNKALKTPQTTTRQIEEKPQVKQIDKSCPEPRKGALLDHIGCEKTIALEGYFGFDQISINPEFAQKIQEVGKVLEENPQYYTILEGHTDSTGSKAYNQKLSLERAKAVAKELEKTGVVKEKIVTKGYGFEKPKASNETKEGRAQNRRVEAKFFIKE